MYNKHETRQFVWSLKHTLVRKFWDTLSIQDCTKLERYSCRSNCCCELSDLTNPCSYSSEKPKSTDVVAARRQCWEPFCSVTLFLNLNFSFLNRISLLFVSGSHPILFYRDWVNLVPDPISPEKFLGYSWESNLGPLD